MEAGLELRVLYGFRITFDHGLGLVLFTVTSGLESVPSRLLAAGFCFSYVNGAAAKMGNHGIVNSVGGSQFLSGSLLKVSCSGHFHVAADGVTVVDEVGWVLGTLMASISNATTPARVRQARYNQHFRVSTTELSDE